MDVELEQMEEGIGNKVDGTVYVVFVAEEEFEGTLSFGAGGEGDVLEVAGGVGYLWWLLS